MSSERDLIYSLDAICILITQHDEDAGTGTILLLIPVVERRKACLTREEKRRSLGLSH